MIKILLILPLLFWLGCEDKKDENTSNGGTGNGGTGDVYGCTDPDATNYNPDATIDDGSCEDSAADIVVGISLDSGDCSSCSVGNPGGTGLMGTCYSCVQIVLDYSVENVGTATANDVRIRFKVEYQPYTNIQLGQTSWYSDVINLSSISPGEHTSGSIVALDYNYYNGTSLTTYNSVRVYLSSLLFSD